MLSNIKTRNIPLSTASLKIMFGKSKKISVTDATIVSKNFNWTFNEIFEYSTTRRGLRESFLKISLLEKQGKEIGDVKINLHELATGPFHLDFFIKMKKGYKEPGRINLDVKMSQVIQVSVKPQRVTCKLKDNLKEKFYNFSLKMSLKEQEFLSNHSPKFHNVIVASAIPEKTEEIKDSKEVLRESRDLNENYQMIMDENKILQTQHLRSNVNRNFEKMRNDNSCSNTDTVETNNDEMNQVPILTNVRHRASTSKPLDDDLNQIPILSAIKQRASTFKEGDDYVMPMLQRNQSIPKNIIAKNKDIAWDFCESLENTVCLEVGVSLKELFSGTLQFFLWANKEVENCLGKKEGLGHDESVEEVIIDHKLVGECYIGFKKLFMDFEKNFGEGTGAQDVSTANTTKSGITDSDSASAPIEKKPDQIRLAQFSEKLWYHGVCIGELEGDFFIQASHFYKQMICGVRTEDGIQRSSTVFLNKDKNNKAFGNSTNIKEVKILEQHKENIKKIVFDVANNKTNPRMRIKLIDELSTNIHKILEILKSSHKESINSFLYKTPENLLASQRILTSIAKHIIDYADEVPVSLRPIYYESLLVIMNRGELQLNFMGFDESYKDFLKNAQKISFKNEGYSCKVEIKNIKTKFEVCERYQALLYQALQKVLDKVNQKGLPDKERAFIEEYTAIAYFRVPEFRKKMLEKIHNAVKEIKIDEWRGTEWMLDEKIAENQKNQQIVALFDWERDFYVYLKNTEEGEKNYNVLTEILNDPQWQQRMQKRGIAFYFFLTEWAKLVNNTVVIKEHVPWQDLPGYTILVKALLVSLKQREVKAYPEALVNASIAFLKNEKLLNTYIAIVYNKTKLYDSNSVFQVFEIINKWLTALRENNKTISPTFDYSFFFKGIAMILEEDHAINITKVLWMLYNNFNILPYDQKLHFSEYLFGKLFFKLFLHWSWNVRQVFHHFLLYRLYHQHRTSHTQLENLDDLKKELLMNMQKRQNLNRDKKLLTNDFILMEYSRNMTIIENEHKRIKDQKSQRLAVELGKVNNSSNNNNNSNFKRPTKTKNLSQVMQVPQRLLLEHRVEMLQNQNLFGKLPLRQTQTDIPNTQTLPEILDINQINPQFSKDVASNNDIDIQLPTIKSFSQGGDGEIQAIASQMTKPMRSESLNVPSSYMDYATGNNKPSHFADLDRAMADNEGSMSSKRETDDVNTPKTGPTDKKKVIHRRILYFNKQSNQIKEIPEQYMVYLEAAYSEYENLKENYLFWLSEVEQSLKGKREDEIRKFKADPKVPELIVNVPMDENVPEPEQD